MSQISPVPSSKGTDNPAYRTDEEAEWVDQMNGISDDAKEATELNNNNSNHNHDNINNLKTTSSEMVELRRDNKVGTIKVEER